MTATSPEVWDQNALFVQQRDTCIELGKLRREIAQLEADELQQRAVAWAQLNDGTRNITTIREQMQYVASSDSIERILLQGEVAQLEAQLRWLEARIAYLPYMCAEDDDDPGEWGEG